MGRRRAYSAAQARRRSIAGSTKNFGLTDPDPVTEELLIMASPRHSLSSFSVLISCLAAAALIGCAGSETLPGGEAGKGGSSTPGDAGSSGGGTSGGERGGTTGTAGTLGVAG